MISPGSVSPPPPLCGREEQKACERVADWEKVKSCHYVV